ncbi:hypothetical protein K437DRAFT_272548 [Tilletiaria anomala UBC 951]|uniref:DUF8059 domain-containing protein n=1 Tax=Tilletiaria anomala (strain ATCC 24038 / CBS 436.72 / UBC 951) TaxID=1037660 RepID=A0A066WEK1_TILAU|nr:uncharacterized protein K437DRAFT_272548 [Tilletiaria anomala UBC 951]KDN52342.1 hypothetical protein K437DRAFT_272548 [Tilletiaria anomala UBC 951]
MGDVPAHLLELPLHLGTMSFGAIVMGMAGHDIRLFHMIRHNLAGSSIGGQFSLEDNGLGRVDFAALVIGAITFVWGIICIRLCVGQFKGRRGNYTGEGTKAWLPVTLIYLIILGAWTGITSAYTAYANTRRWSLSPGPAYSTPFSEGVQYALYQIAQSFYSSSAASFYIPDGGFAALGIQADTISPWNSATTAEQANALVNKYLRNGNFYRALVIVLWLTLATVFTATVVHFFMPIVLKYFGLTREDKRKKEMRGLESRDYA